MATVLIVGRCGLARACGEREHKLQNDLRLSSRTSGHEATAIPPIVGCCGEVRAQSEGAR
jgi:hypothetical protein